MDDKKFEILFGGYVTLSVNQIWPDGDGPEDPSAEDVKNVMESCGRQESVLSDWDLTDFIEVTVSDGGVTDQRVWSFD